MKSIRISDEAYGLAHQEALLMSRSIAQQFEHWMRLGMNVEASNITSTQVRGLLLQGAPRQDAVQELPVPLRQAIDLIAGRLPPGVSAAQDRVLRREASSLLKKHFEMRYGELDRLAPARRQQLAQELLAAETKERRKP